MKNSEPQPIDSASSGRFSVGSAPASGASNPAAPTMPTVAEPVDTDSSMAISQPRINGGKANW
ncbi:hypothetical protein D3C85_1807480 [compost metagenome]